MAHFAEINVFKKVVRVLVVEDKDTQDKHGNEVESVGAKYLSDAFGGTWLKTSYNTKSGVHTSGGTPFRKNYAGTSYTYDETRDAFIPPKEYSSWTLNESTCNWEPPIPMPADNKLYKWNESTTSWDEII
tara:strand:+ start:77 stop:466 length:390 start_codon:yes stop_codon:yes gene_type:complete